MKPLFFLLSCWLAFGAFPAELKAQGGLLILNECDDHPENLNHFFPNISRKISGNPADYVYPTFEELVYWRGNDLVIRKGIRNRQVAAVVTEKVGSLLSEKGQETICPSDETLNRLKQQWNLPQNGEQADTLRKRFRKLIAEKFQADHLLLLTDCICGFQIKSQKDPGKKPYEVSGKAELLIEATWAIYDRKSGRIVEEFHTHGTGEKTWEHVSRKQAYELRSKTRSPENVQDSTLKMLMIAQQKNEWHWFDIKSPSIFSTLDDSSIRYGQPAVFPLAEQAVKEFMPALQEKLSNP